MKPATEDSLRFELLRVEEGGDGVARYRGEAVDAAATTVELEVVVVEDDGAPGGLAANTSAQTDDEALRGPLERTVGAMVTSAVRTARREGRPPPRRVRRWRARGDLR